MSANPGPGDPMTVGAWASLSGGQPSIRFRPIGHNITDIINLKVCTRARAATSRPTGAARSAAHLFMLMNAFSGAACIGRSIRRKVENRVFLLREYMSAM